MSSPTAASYELSASDYVAVFVRRRGAFIGAVAGVVLAATLLAVLWPLPAGQRSGGAIIVVLPNLWSIVMGNASSWAAKGVTPTSMNASSSKIDRERNFMRCTPKITEKSQRYPV
ncbi:MAG: hypothetical protein HC809_12495, partial [Gammaproteobacteria bacterium]|nr:hypothetical protein [Gammaproteobacteria bacterium]